MTQVNGRGLPVLMMLVVAGLVAVVILPSAFADFDKRLPGRCADDLCEAVIGEVEVPADCTLADPAAVMVPEASETPSAPVTRTLRVTASCGGIGKGLLADLDKALGRPEFDKTFVVLRAPGAPVHLSLLRSVEFRKNGEVLRTVSVNR